jgi:hypothetical protein
MAKGGFFATWKHRIEIQKKDGTACVEVKMSLNCVSVNRILIEWEELVCENRHSSLSVFHFCLSQPFL